MKKRWWYLVVLVLAFVSCSPNTRPVVVNKSPNSQSIRTQSEHVVRSGETLYSIAFSAGLDYQSLARANGIKAPFTIYPGQRIRLSPPSSANPASNPTRSNASVSPQPASTNPGGASSSAATQSASVDRTVSPVPARDRIKQWYWPARGKIVSQYRPEAGINGIRITDAHGSSINVAADGQVVYVGDGLRGYGNLVIVQHNDTFLSAYAHNDVIVVAEGDKVRAGQMIARMGSSGTDQTMLHFEIRQDGKSVDPLLFLK